MSFFKKYPHLNKVSQSVIAETAENISKNLSVDVELNGLNSSLVLMSSFENSKLFAFDFDGTIADTEVLHQASFNIMLNVYNVHIETEQFVRYRGNSETDVYSLISKDYGVILPVESTRQHRLNIFLQLVQFTDIKSFNYIKEILSKAFYNKSLVVVISAQKSNIISHILSRFGLLQYFSAILTEDLFLNNKKNLLKSLPSRFYCSENEIVFFEDSKQHIETAKKLGIETYLVKSIK